VQSSHVWPAPARVEGVVMSVVEALDEELLTLGDAAARSTLAATARSLAVELDADNSATSKSMCAKALADVMREVRALAPAKPEEDEVERARKRRVERLAGKSAAGTASSS
jgi:hypothetical protein